VSNDDVPTGSGDAIARWQSALRHSAELRAEGGVTLRIPPRRLRRSPFTPGPPRL